MGKRLVVSAKGVVVALEFEENIAAAKPGLGKVGVERKRLVVGREGFFVAPAFIEDIAAAMPASARSGFRL